MIRRREYEKVYEKIIAFLLVFAMVIPTIMLIQNHDTKAVMAEEEDTNDISLMGTSVPKYVFLFIGDE